MQFTLISFVPRPVIKIGESHLINLLIINVFIAVNPQPSESLDHLHPMSKGGISSTSNCVPCCLSCNGNKSDTEVLSWYRKQIFYDPRRAMAIRAWFNDDLKLASVLLKNLN